ncbi:hypothetical protein OUS_1313 [Helicobacter pylori R056a]|uniref:Uncharacterized protein n=1 Tax=Helicobacter pylori R018c TaxID=1145110 RepID=K2KCD8_HELPX|nr:hypothetical protein OUC_1208 [Helicobacter pylori R018c]EKE94478.1 hypothetical protein OUS_1313 [Helicobacter pylori R056a]
MSGVLPLNLPLERGVVGLSGWFKRYKGCGWVKTTRYDYPTLTK